MPYFPLTPKLFQAAETTFELNNSMFVKIATVSLTFSNNELEQFQKK